MKYTYDNIYEISEVYRLSPSPATLETFSYDGVGNRTTDADYSDYSYNTNNQLTSYDSINFTYDKNGNLTRKTQNGTDITTYTFDYENKITRIDYPDETYSAYKYDPLGRRIEKRDRSGNIRRYVCDGDNFIAEYDGSNDLLASYVQGRGIDNPLSMYRSGQMYWYHRDALGSVYQLTDSNQDTARAYDYSTFGKIISESGSLANPFTYTAREYDSNSGLYYYRARYYDAGLGRFVSRDPIRYRSSLPHKDLYSYVANSPANWTDPAGKDRFFYEEWYVGDGIYILYRCTCPPGPGCQGEATNAEIWPVWRKTYYPQSCKCTCYYSDGASRPASQCDVEDVYRKEPPPKRIWPNSNG